MLYLNCLQEIAIEAGGHILEQKRASRRRLDQCVTLAALSVTRWELKHAIVDMLYGISVEALFMLQVTATTK